MKKFAGDVAVELASTSIRVLGLSKTYMQTEERCYAEHIGMHGRVGYLQVCNGMSHLWGSLLAEVDQADVTCHMVPMWHGCAEHWVQFQLLSLQLHLYIPTAPI